jgi:uncharacterized protein (DUF111 family)
MAECLMRETTTIGLRWRIDRRLKASRQTRRVETTYGPIRCKVAEVDGRIVNVSPEYDDCRRAAEEINVPLKDVMGAARAAARK